MTKIILNNSNSDKTFIHLGLTMSTSSSSSSAAPSMDNVEILLAVYQFKPGSPLQKYLKTKMPEKYNFMTFTFANLLSDLKYIIKKEFLFDILNPSIIICDSDLEAALNIKALHVTEVRDCVLTQLERVSPFQSKKPSLKRLCYAIETRSAKKQRYFNELNQSKNKANQQMPQKTFQEAESYRLKPLLRIALKRMPSFPCHQRTFKYNEICNYLLKYIISYKNDLFDERNIRICMVHNDPLGKAFNVKAFHRCQVTSLLRRNIIAV